MTNSELTMDGSGDRRAHASLRADPTDAAGRFDNPGFSGWGRAPTDANGIYRFRTASR